MKEIDKLQTLNKRQQQAINTKLKISEKAMLLFSEKGYEKVTIKDICKAADISVGAFYHHFKSKESIANIVYYQVDMIVEDRTEASNITDPYEKILFIFKAADELIIDLGYRFVGETLQQSVFTINSYSNSFERYPYRAVTSLLEEGLKSGRFKDIEDCRFLAERLIRLGRALTFDWCTTHEKYSLVDETKYFLDLFMNKYLIEM